MIEVGPTMFVAQAWLTSKNCVRSHVTWICMLVKTTFPIPTGGLHKGVVLQHVSFHAGSQQCHLRHSIHKMSIPLQRLKYICIYILLVPCWTKDHAHVIITHAHMYNQPSHARTHTPLSCLATTQTPILMSRQRSVATIEKKKTGTGSHDCGSASEHAEIMTYFITRITMAQISHHNCE